MDGIMADMCREVEYMSGTFCNEEMTREKSVRKETRYERNAKRISAEKLSRSDVA